MSQDNFDTPAPTSSGQPSGTVDLMAAFDDGLGGGKADQDKGQGSVQVPEFQIDEKFAGLPKEEAIFRTWQSRYDSLDARSKKVAEELAVKDKHSQLLGDLMEDDQLFEAFVAERNPDLIKPRDLTTVIQTELKKEFGEYQPADSETRTPGSKAWLYDKRADEIYKKVSGGSSEKLMTVKQVREARAAQAKEKQAEAQRDIENIKTKYNVDDAGIEQFHGWAQKISAEDLYRMYRFALRTSGAGGGGNLQQANGGFVSGPSSKEKFLNDVMK